MSRSEARQRPGGEGGPSRPHRPYSTPQVAGVAGPRLVLNGSSSPQPQGWAILQKRKVWLRQGSHRPGQSPARTVTGQSSALAFFKPQTSPSCPCPSRLPEPPPHLLCLKLLWSAPPKVALYICPGPSLGQSPRKGQVSGGGDSRSTRQISRREQS